MRQADGCGRPDQVSKVRGRRVGGRRLERLRGRLHRRLRVGHRRARVWRLALGLPLAVCLAVLVVLPAAAQTPDPDPLVVSLDHSWPPLSSADADGEPQGILVDLWTEVGQRLGRPVEFRLTDWNETIEQVVRGEAMVHGGLFASEERRERLAFGRELIPLSAVLYVRSSHLVLEVDDLLDVRVGVVDDSFERAHMRSEYPRLTYRTFPNNAQMVQAATEGAIDAFAVDYPVGVYLLDRYASPGDFHVLQPLYSHTLRYAVAPGSEALVPAIDSAVASIPADELARISQRWVTTERVETIPAWFWPGVVALVCSLLLLLAVTYARILRSRKEELEREVKARTASLVDEQARLQNIIEGGNLGTWEAWLVTGDLKINDRWAEMIGTTKEEVGPVTYETWAALVHPDDLAGTEAAIRAHLSGETETYSSEFRMRHANGEWVWILSTGRLMPARDGGPASHMFGCHVSLQEQRLLEKQLARQQRMEGIGALAGGVAHDLNNILTPILLSLERLREEDLSADERVALVDGMEEGARRGADIVGQVLSYARGEEGARALIDVEPVLLGLHRMLAETLPRNIRFVVEVSEGLAPVKVDPTHLRQILLNLSLNARDALPPEGGEIRVRAEVRGEGSHLAISVSDTGTGIAPENLPRIFDPFFTTKPQGKGTGLGLSTTLTLVESNAGTIDVESEPGRGTSFELRFPTVQPAPGSEPPRPAPGSRPHRPTSRSAASVPAGATVLVVDDEPGILQAVGRTLRRFGHHVIEAPDGRAGLDAFGSAASEIDLVITDIMMPEMDGTALIQALRTRAPDLPILAMSGLVQDDGLRAESGSHRLDFLPKPFTIPELMEAVDRGLAHR